MIRTIFRPVAVAKDLKNPTLMSFVDMARWMAAAMVMVGHLRNPLFLGYGDLPSTSRPLWVKVWYFVTGYHAEAVLVFFVLSGFLVGGLSAARAASGTFKFDNYAIDRVARLFIAFIPAVLLTLLLDSIGARWFGGTGLYNGTHPMIVQKVQGIAFQDQLSWPILVGNLAMLQHFFVGELGSNRPLWSLSYEFWFYAVFGLVLTALLIRSARRWALGLIAIAATAILGVDFILYFGLWLIGLVAALVAPRRVGHPLIATAALFVWLLLIRIKDTQLDSDPSLKMAAHYVMAILFGWVIVAMRDRRVALFERIGAANKFLADFSYSLYLIHFPVMIFSIAVLGQLTGDPGFARAFLPTNAVGLTTYIAMVIFLFFTAWCFAQATERRTAWLRGWLKRRIFRS